MNKQLILKNKYYNLISVYVENHYKTNVKLKYLQLQRKQKHFVESELNQGLECKQ